MNYNTSKLLTSIRNTASVPNDDARFSDDILLMFADEEIGQTIQPLVIYTHEEYFVKDKTVEVDSNGEVQIPQDAYMAKLRDVRGVEGDVEIDIPKLELSDVNKTYGFYIQGRTIKVSSLSNISSLKLYYYARHNNLAPVVESTPVSSKNTNLNTITVGNVFEGLSAGTYVDAIDSITGEVKVSSVFVSSVAGNVLTIDSVDSISLGDTICLANKTSILNLPEPLISLLVQSVANRVYEDIGDTEAYNLGMSKYNNRVKQILKVLEQRVVSKAPVVVRRRTRRGY